MLKDFERKTEDKDVLKAETKALREQLTAQQQLLMEAKLPVIVLIEGWAAAGKGSLIKELISEIDPRFYSVVSPVIGPEKEERYPFLYPFFSAIPENGKITFLDSGWMESAVRKFLRHEITRKEYQRRIRQVNEFERQLRDGGYLVLKIFLHIDKKEQFERLRNLAEHPETEWRVTDEDIWQHKEYKRFQDAYEAFMEDTGDLLPWHVLDGKNRKGAVRDAMALLTGQIQEGLDAGRYVGEPFDEEFPMKEMPHLSEVDLSLTIEDDEYKKELKKLQKRLSELHNIIYRKKIPVILCYEGWDAAGKGGNIKRVAQAIDARAYTVFPSPAPTKPELMHPHLWRYWIRLPKAGHVGIYDRSWYGRVLVERVEGFASPEQWTRAYEEINSFERELVQWGAILLKFWVDITPEEQLRRFEARQLDPTKTWKITDEDWRNRDKYPQYKMAIDDMFRLTSTTYAPWIVLESDDKHYARIQALRTINEALEARMHR